MSPLLPLIAIDGLILGFTSTSLSKLVPSSDSIHQKSLQAGFCVTIFGFGTILGGFLSGYLSNKLNIHITGKLSIILYAICCLITLLAVNFLTFEGGLMVSFIWGIGKYFIEGWLYIAASYYYLGKA